MVLISFIPTFSAFFADGTFLSPAPTQLAAPILLIIGETKPVLEELSVKPASADCSERPDVRHSLHHQRAAGLSRLLAHLLHHGCPVLRGQVL